MSTRNLEAFFQPKSITVIGASEKPTLGGVVLRNLIESGYEGHLTAINSNGYPNVNGVPCHPEIGKLAAPPDLAILCTPPTTIPRLVRQLGRRGTSAALILMGGLAATLSKSQRPLTESLHAAARPSGIRLLGPNSLGILAPRQKLFASYAHMNVLPGEVAYVGESAVLGSALIDWACGRGIGFSHFLTLGDVVDVDMADVIDYLASDPKTRAILLHIEHVRDARRFIASVRAASRGKLVLAIKSGHVPQSQRPVEPVAPGVPNGDAVYDAVMRRAGALRVKSTDELFDALETLTRMRPLRGERLAILCNGFGPGAVAADALLDQGGQLAQFSDSTLAALKTDMPQFARAGNPADLGVLAGPTHYARALQLMSQDPGVDAALVVHAPSRQADAETFARAVVEATAETRFNLLTSWMGQASVAPGRQVLDAAGIPTYETPDKAVQAFMHMVRHRRNQMHLRETPAEARLAHPDQRKAARKKVAKVLRSGRDYLLPGELRQLVVAYGIPVAEASDIARSKQVEALKPSALEPMALRIVHEAHCHPFVYEDRSRSRWRGVRFDLSSEDELRQAVGQLKDWVSAQFPDSRVLGFTAQPMRRGRGSIQVSVGFTRDAVFGPLLLFGAGGRTVTTLEDRRIGLPPVNLALARDLIRGSSIERLIQEGSHSHPDEDLQALCGVLVALSQMIIEIPELRGLEINPLTLSRDGLLALDMSANLASPDRQAPTAITPYPQELCEWVVLPKSDRHVELRPIRGEDEPAHLEFHQRLSPRTIRFRYFYNRKSFAHAELAQMTQIDYEREMVFIASAVRPGDGGQETLGEVRAWSDPDNIRAEFSVIVRDDLRGEGLGQTLLKKMIDYCRARGTLEIVGSVLPDNKPMLMLAERLGFRCRFDEANDVMELRLALRKPRQEWQRQRLQLPVI
jgi:acetyltransferase